MPTKIKCDSCGNEIEITEALKKELEEKILKEAEAIYNEKIKTLEDKQESLITQHKKQIEEAKEEMLKQASVEAYDKISKEFDLQIKNSKSEIEQREKQNNELQTQLLTIMKQLREARDAENRMKIEFEKQLLEEQDKIKFTAKREAEDELNFKIAEKDKMLTDAQKQIKELERKIQQGSQQLQGEIQELQLEELLKKEFIYDEIKEVPKGINGADVLQVVKTKSGLICGTIVWESKNTKSWQQIWVQKLIEDQRALKAEIAVLVSSVLPSEILSFGVYDKIWLSDMKSAISLARALRQQLIGIQSAQEANKGKGDKAALVYEYLISNSFKQRIETLVEYFRDRQDEINKERAVFLRKWDKEEKSIRRVVESTAGIYGDLQGLIGNALPKIQQLELPEPEIEVVEQTALPL